jgi:DNA-directed RNA polymerase specialized sigma24 family protein
MKKSSRPRPETKPGRLDKPFSHWVEDYASRSSTDESSSNYSRLDHFFEAYGLTVEEDHGRSMDIRDQLASLPRDMQRVVKLNIYESRSLPETSEMTGFTLWEVRKLLKEAKAILRVGLRDYC